MNKQSWRDFYEKRVNSGYQEYFNKRYSVMVDFIVGNFGRNTGVLEEGIGIGSLANSLISAGMRNVSGFDNSTDMICLCKLNTKALKRVYFDCIKWPNVPGHSKLRITHGVLEHFSDEHIKLIMNRYRREKVQSVHYVPLNKYKEPSFGDERLLHYNYWLELTEPKEYYLFNDGHDLLIFCV